MVPPLVQNFALIAKIRKIPKVLGPHSPSPAPINMKFDTKLETLGPFFATKVLLHRLNVYLWDLKNREKLRF